MPAARVRPGRSSRGSRCRASPPPDLLRLPGRLRAAVAAAPAALEDVGADVVVGFGGYVATPAYLAARRAGVPVVVHEQNALPGIANRLGARWAAARRRDLPRHPAAATRVHTGMPLRSRDRRAGRAPDRGALRRAARAELGLDPDAPTLLVTGGRWAPSGSTRSSAGLRRRSSPRPASRCCTPAGRGKQVPLAARRRRPAATSVPHYLDGMDTAYAAADLVACRSGAGTVSELTARGAARRCTSRCPSATASSAATPSRVVAAGGGVARRRRRPRRGVRARARPPAARRPRRRSPRGRGGRPRAPAIHDGDEQARRPASRRWRR